MNHIRSGLIAAGFGALSIVVAACGAGNPGNSSSDSGKESKSMIVGTTDKVVSIDPAGAYDNGSSAVQTQVYSYLMTFPEGKTTPQPDAAKKCKFTKPTEYTCTMKSGLKFANGDPLTAKSAAFSYKRIRKINDPNGPASLLENMKSVKADGNKKVVFTLKSANDQTFPQVLATSAGPIVDEKVYPVDKTLSDKKVVSQKATSGPYMIGKYEKNKLAEFKKNPNYHGLLGQPKTGNVTMKYYTDANNLKLDIQHKNIDVAFRSLTPTDVASLKKAKGVTVHTGAGGESRYMVFNLKTMPGKGKKQKLAIRKAMASSFDRAAISKQVYKGTTVGEYSPIPDGQRGATKPFKKLYGTKPNKAKAAKYLHDAGVSTPVKLTIWYNPDHYGSSSAEEYNAVKRQLEATKLFKVKLQSAEWNTYNEERVKDSYPIYQLGWFPDFPDPDNYLSPFYGPNNFVKSHYKDATMTKMLKSETTDRNHKHRMATIGKIQQRAAEQIPYLPLLTTSQVAVSKDDVKGVEGTLDASFKFRFTSLHR